MTKPEIGLSFAPRANGTKSPFALHRLPPLVKPQAKFDMWIILALATALYVWLLYRDAQYDKFKGPYFSGSSFEFIIYTVCYMLFVIVWLIVLLVKK